MKWLIGDTGDPSTPKYDYQSLGVQVKIFKEYEPSSPLASSWQLLPATDRPESGYSQGLHLLAFMVPSKLITIDSSLNPPLLKIEEYPATLHLSESLGDLQTLLAKFNTGEWELAVLGTGEMWEPDAVVLVLMVIANHAEFASRVGLMTVKYTEGYPQYAHMDSRFFRLI